MAKFLLLLSALLLLGSVAAQELEIHWDDFSHHRVDNDKWDDLDNINNDDNSQQTNKAGLEPLVCHRCVQEECPPPSNCVAGVVADACGCCHVCARSEHELCDNGDGDKLYGQCGDNLVCTRNSNEATCECQMEKAVCGSDSATYDSICALNEESVRRGDNDDNPLVMEHWGACKQAPSILTAPVDSYGALGSNLTLECEARGNPAPLLSWKFVSESGQSLSLPSDDQGIAIQTRGGPEPFTVTGWAQIMALQPMHAGHYHCIAANELGQVYTSAQLGVYRREP